MTLAAGTRIGPYEVVGPLGAGGMGEVYRAADPRLKRHVAVKILPASVADDPDRLLRFRREAEVLASLNHPHIAVIHGLEEIDGISALVMELVEGEDLSERLARGPMTVDDVRPIARQIAQALEAAHARGIVHRDLKPANIKVRPDGTIKVLDFGLAKFVESPASDDVSRSPTITNPLATRHGSVIGTPAYMSPEQAKGLTATTQTDIWAFGLVVFEMLTGRVAFPGETVTEVMAGVLKSDPDWGALPADTPKSIRRLLRRCLEKDERQRLRDIGDARLEIDDVETSDVSGTQRQPRLARGERVVWVAATAALAAAIVILAARGTGGTLPPPVLQLDVVTPAVSDPFDLASFALSPDGRTLAFVGDGDEQGQIRLRTLESGVSRALPGTARASMLAWSPDGHSMTFNADGDLKRVDLDAVRPRTLAQATFMVGSSSNADGVILYAPNPASPLMRVSSEGGAPVAVTTLEPGQAGHAFPHFLPDGRHFLYSAFGRPDARGVYVGRLDDPLKQRLLETDSPAAYVDGHLYFLEKGGVFAQAFDAATLTLTGRPMLVADGVLENVGYFLTFSVAGNGTIAFRTGTASRARQFVWFDRTGRVLNTVGEPEVANSSNPSPSPDGTQVAVFRRGQGGSDSDIWLVETRRGVMTRFTTTPGEDIFPSWSRDGTRIAFTSNRNRDFAIYAKSVSTGAEQLLVPGTAEESFANDWSPDGKVLLWQRRGVKTGWDIWSLALGVGTSSAFLQTEDDERDATFSPDGRWIAYCSNASGRFEVYVRPFAGGVSTLVSTNGGAQPRWRGDGRELFYLGLDGRLLAASLSTTASGGVEIQVPAVLFPARVGRVVIPGGSAEYIPSPDGSRILMNTIVQDPGPAPIRLVLNWSPPVR